MSKDTTDNRMVHRVTHWVTTLLYSIASLTLILAAFSLAGKALYEVYVSVLVEGKIDKDILNAITYTVIAIAVCDVGRFLVAEEVEHEKRLHSLAEIRKTITRFMVVISIALSLEGLVGVFEAGNSNMTEVVYPIAIVICAILVLVALGFYQRFSVETEIKLLKVKDQLSEDDSL